jgi:serine/threonine protein kinase
MVKPGDNDALAAFRREVRVLHSEHVPNDVLHRLEYYYLPEGDNSADPPEQPFFVAERIDGQPILEYVREHRPMPVIELVKLIERGFHALDRLHSCNIIHGDVLAGNVLVQKGEVVRLVGLGRTRPIDRFHTRPLKSDREVIADHHADSVFEAEARRAVRDDIRAFASLAFQALTDRPPGKRPEDAKADADALDKAGVPSDAKEVLMKALRAEDQGEEADRKSYASAADVARDLRACLERQVRWAARKRQAVVDLLVGSALLCIALAAAWVGWARYWSDERLGSRVRDLESHLRDLGSKLASRPQIGYRTFDQRIAWTNGGASDDPRTLYSSGPTQKWQSAPSMPTDLPTNAKVLGVMVSLQDWLPALTRSFNLIDARVNPETNAVEFDIRSIDDPSIGAPQPPGFGHIRVHLIYEY